MVTGKFKRLIRIIYMTVTLPVQIFLINLGRLTRGGEIADGYRHSQIIRNNFFMELRVLIRNVLSLVKAKKDGLHVKHIARIIINESRTLFSDESEFNFDDIKRKVNAILLQDIRKKNSEFKRVKNPKTKKYRKGVYKIKTSRQTNSLSLFQ